MSVFDLFSKRQKRLRGEAPDVFTYDAIPQTLRVQIVHMLRDTLGSENDYGDEYHENRRVVEAYQTIVNLLRREYGVFVLSQEKDRRRSSLEEFFNFILFEQDVERVLDAIELSFCVVVKVSSKYDYRNISAAAKQAEDAVVELNSRFLEHCIGYRFESNSIVRIDSEFVHDQIVKPALALLHAQPFKGAEAEFLLAHEHYRHDRIKEALAECLKALESTLKGIAVKRKWKHESNATAKPLLDLMFEKKLVPDLWANHFAGLRAMLESGVPTARNRLGGHGQGADVVVVPSHIAAFALHQAAAAIVFLITAEKQMT